MPHDDPNFGIGTLARGPISQPHDPALLKPAEIAEFLHALALHLGGVDVALAVDADEVEVVELAELMADAPVGTHQLAVGAIDHVEFAVRVVDHEEISRAASGHFTIEPIVPGALSFSTEISRTKVPSLRNICIRLWLRSHTSTSPSLVMVMQCTGLPNCWAAAPSDPR